MLRIDITQTQAPCVLHVVHSPITVINELHHPFLQSWQRKLWGTVRDDRTVSVCATGHNSVHAAITHFERWGVFPGWCVGKTRDLAEEGFVLRAAAILGT